MKTKYFIDESEPFNYDHYKRMNKAQNDYSLRGCDALIYDYIKNKNPQYVVKVQSLFKGIEDRGQIWNISNFLKKYGFVLLGSSLFAMNTAFGLKEYNSQIALTLAELSTPLLEVGAVTGVLGTIGQKIVEKLNDRDLDKSKGYLRSRLMRIIKMEKDYDSVTKPAGVEPVSKTEQEFSDVCKKGDIKISLRQVVNDGESYKKYLSSIAKINSKISSEEMLSSNRGSSSKDGGSNNEFVELDLDDSSFGCEPDNPKEPVLDSNKNFDNNCIDKTSDKKDRYLYVRLNTNNYRFYKTLCMLNSIKC